MIAFIGNGTKWEELKDLTDFVPSIQNFVNVRVLDAQRRDQSYAMLVHSQAISAEELLQSLECINCDTIPASLYFGKEFVRKVNDMFFLDWITKTILSVDTDWSGKFMTCFLCECAGCSTPWNQNTKLALPASWYDPQFWRLHVGGASSDETQSHICVRHARSRSTFFHFISWTR